jgi:hypothetical protein
LTAPTALEERSGKHYLPVDASQALNNVYQKLALIRSHGSSQLLASNVEVLTMAERLIVTSLQLIVDYYKGTFLTALSVAFDVAVNLLSSATKANVPENPEEPQLEQHLQEALQEADMAWNCDAKDNGLNTLAPQDFCKDLEQTCAHAKESIGLLQKALPVLAYGPGAVHDQDVLDAIAMMQDPPVLLSECASFDAFRTVVKKVCHIAVVARYAVKQGVTAGPMYDTNRLAAILALNNEAFLNTAFSSSSVAKLSVFYETYVHGNSKFITSWFMRIAPFLLLPCR